MAPTEQKSLVIAKKGAPFTVQTLPVPSPSAGEILARVDSTALNPIDWKIQVFALDMVEYPAVLGTDAAGIVEDVGEGVTAFKKGDKM
jgi:NADPH:quinone reductase-like Zn-dependent oxidoreductase